MSHRFLGNPSALSITDLETQLYHLRRSTEQKRTLLRGSGGRHHAKTSAYSFLSFSLSSQSKSDTPHLEAQIATEEVCEKEREKEREREREKERERDPK